MCVGLVGVRNDRGKRTYTPNPASRGIQLDETSLIDPDQSPVCQGLIGCQAAKIYSWKPAGLHVDMTWIQR